MKAVVWDFGGVVTSSPFEAFNRFEKARGLPHDFVRTVNATNPLDNAWALFERAEIETAAFDALFAEEARALGQEVRGADILALLSGDVRPPMVEAIRTCRAAGLKVACITNNVRTGEGAGMSASSDKARQVAEVMSLFEVVIESSKVGVRKPDPRIYRMMVEALGVPASECVYLDDLGINCKPAAALGMTAIKVGDPAVALQALSEATGLQFASA